MKQAYVSCRLLREHIGKRGSYGSVGSGVSDTEDYRPYDIDTDTFREGYHERTCGRYDHRDHYHLLFPYEVGGSARNERNDDSGYVVSRYHPSKLRHRATELHRYIKDEQVRYAALEAHNEASHHRRRQHHLFPEISPSVLLHRSLSCFFCYLHSHKAYTAPSTRWMSPRV